MGLRARVQGEQQTRQRTVSPAVAQLAGMAVLMQGDGMLRVLPPWWQVRASRHSRTVSVSGEELRPADHLSAVHRDVSVAPGPQVRELCHRC